METIVTSQHLSELAVAAMSLADLEAAAAELSNRCAERGVQIKRARREACSELPKRCTPWMRGVAMRVLALSDFNLAFVIQYLSQKGRSETAGDAMDWCGALSGEEILKLCETSDDSQANRQLREARKFVEEARLAAWVKTQNAAKGIAPTAKVVLETASPCLAQGYVQENRYRWLRRFMARWGGRRARLVGGDTLSDGEFREKVGRVHPLVWHQIKIWFAASGP